MPTQARRGGVFTKSVVHVLHDLHPQAGDDEEESGPHVSHVTGPEESAGRPHMSPIPTHAQIRGNCHPPADAPHTKKLHRNSFESIGVAILRDATIEHNNGHSSSHRASQKLSMARFGSKLRGVSFLDGCGYARTCTSNLLYAKTCLINNYLHL